MRTYQASAIIISFLMAPRKRRLAQIIINDHAESILHQRQWMESGLSFTISPADVDTGMDNSAWEQSSCYQQQGLSQ
jgi:hypothetical protein